MRLNVRNGDPLSAEEALARLLARTAPLPPERAPLPDAAGRSLAEDMTARLDSPPFTNSARDGYAVRAADLQGRDLLPLQGESFAGGPSPRLAPGRCLKVMTGAPIPEGADAVVMREFAREEDGQVRFLHAPAAGDHVRLQGEDLRRETPLLKKGSLLRPWEVALLASQGVGAVSIARRPRVALLTTGDEVDGPGASLRPGAVHDANGPALRAALERAGALAVSLRHAADDLKTLAYRMRRDLQDADLMVTAGGASVGDRDFVRAAFAELGGEEVFWRVAIRPGGPLFAGLLDGKWLFGLPGNPLSALVCFEEFVAPVLEALQGRTPAADRFPLKAVLRDGFKKPAGLRQYLFCRTEDGGRTLRVLPQGSALMKQASAADALAMAPEGAEALAPGEEVSFRWL